MKNKMQRSWFKRILVAMLAMSMVISPVTSYAAADEGQLYDASGGVILETEELTENIDTETETQMFKQEGNDSQEETATRSNADTQEDPQETASYYVEWYDADNEPIQDTDEREGIVGKEVSVTDADTVVEGYIFDADNEDNCLKAKVEADGSTVLKLFFTEESVATDAEESSEEGSEENSESESEENSALLSNVMIPEEAEITEEVEPVAQAFSAQQETISYTVVWLDSEGKTLKDSVTRDGVVDDEVTVTDEDKNDIEIEGNIFTFDEGNTNNILTAKVAEDGSTTLKLYFTANVPEDSNTFNVGTVDELKKAFEEVKKAESGKFTIILTADIVLTKETFYITKNTVTLLGNGHSISCSDTWGASYFFVGYGGSSGILNLGKPDGSDALTIIGEKNGRYRSDQLIKVHGTGVVNMYNGVTLRDHNMSTNSPGSAVDIQGGTFNMHGGTITNCKDTGQGMGGAIAIHYGTFNMYEGVIENCSNTGYVGVGGAVVVGIANKGTFNMYGGTIRDNEAPYGGAVYVGRSNWGYDENWDIAWIQAEGYFNMSGGTITNNNATAGGGVYVRDGKFTMSGDASITGNTAQVGGGLYSSKVPTTPVAVYNNTATVAGADVALESLDRVLAPVGTGWTLTSGKTITGWYIDDDPRWGADDSAYVAYTGTETLGEDEVLCLIAAHELLPSVYTVKWEDDAENSLKKAEKREGLAGSPIAISDEDKTIKGYTFDESASTPLDTIISGDGETVVTLVFNPAEVNYTVKWEDNVGNSLKDSDSRTGLTGSPVVISDEDKTVEGYTFDENASTPLDTIISGDGETVVTLVFNPAEVNYTVKWEDNAGNSLKDAATKTGLTGNTVEISDEDKTVEGYTFDEKASTSLNTIIGGDGKTEVTLVFNPAEVNYTVKWEDNAGNSLRETEIRKGITGSPVAISDGDKTVEGYTFDEKASTPLDTIISGDGKTEVTLVFTPAEVNYTVKWKDDAGNPLKEAVTRKGTTGTVVSVEENDKVVEGYTFDADNEDNCLSETVKADGSTTLTLIFTKNPVEPDKPEPKEVSYKVGWFDADGKEIKAVETRKGTAGTEVSVTEADKLVKGYTFDADNKDNVLTAIVAEDGSTVLKLFFTKDSTEPVEPDKPEPKEVSYTVTWFDKDGKTIKDPETRTAKVGAKVSVTEADKLVKGYTFDADNKDNVLTATVAEDGSTVLKLFFTKDSTEPVEPDKPEPKEVSYKVGWFDADGKEIKAVETRKGTVGKEVSVTNADKLVQGYTFDADNKGNVLTAIVAEDGSTMLKLFFTKDSTEPVEPDKPEPKEVSYTVTWFDKDGKTIKDPETRTAKVGAKVSVTEADKLVKGYTFDADNKGNVLTATVAEDGTTVLKLFFTKDSTEPVEPDTPKEATYRVEWFDVNGKTIKNAETRKGTVGTKVSVTDADKVVEGYIFDATNKGNILTAIVAEDGSTVLKLFFTKKPVDPNSDSPQNPPKDTTPSSPSVTTPNGGIPKTGDDSNLMLYVMLMLASGIGLLVLVIRKHKKDEDEDK